MDSLSSTVVPRLNREILQEADPGPAVYHGGRWVEWISDIPGGMLQVGSSLLITCIDSVLSPQEAPGM